MASFAIMVLCTIISVQVHGAVENEPLDESKRKYHGGPNADHRRPWSVCLDHDPVRPSAALASLLPAIHRASTPPANSEVKDAISGQVWSLLFGKSDGTAGGAITADRLRKALRTVPHDMAGTAQGTALSSVVSIVEERVRHLRSVAKDPIGMASTAAPPLRVAVLSGEGSGCENGSEGCWPGRLEVLVNALFHDVALKNRVDPRMSVVEIKNVGGGATGLPLAFRRFEKYKPHVLLFSYAADKNYIAHSPGPGEKRDGELVSQQWESVEMFIRAVLRPILPVCPSAPDKNGAGADPVQNISKPAPEKISAEEAPPQIPALLVLVDDSIGHRDPSAYYDMSFGLILSRLAGYYGAMFVSYADVVRDVVHADVHADVHANIFSANLFNKDKIIEGNISERAAAHAAVRHLVVAWSVAYAFWEAVSSHCEDERFKKAWDGGFLERITPREDSKTPKITSKGVPRWIIPPLTDDLGLDTVADIWWREEKVGRDPAACQTPEALNRP